MYKIIYRKNVLKDISKIKSIGLDNKVKNLINLIKQDPYTNPPPYEKLLGDLQGAYSRRINVKHRLIYQIFENEKIIKILSIWTQYEKL